MKLFKKILLILSVTFIFLLASCKKNTTIENDEGKQIQSLIYKRIDDLNYKIAFAEDGFVYSCYSKEEYKNTGFEWEIKDTIIIAKYKDSKTGQILVVNIYHQAKEYLIHYENSKTYIYVLEK